MLGLIGGTGLNRLHGLDIGERRSVATRYGAPSAAIQMGTLNGQEVAFLPRHGTNHRIPPHAINYRANLFALKLVGVSHVVGVAAVGGISDNLAPAQIALPDDVIDYTWGRQHSYSMSAADELQHIEFAAPYSEALRLALIRSAQQQSVDIQAGGVHAVTQGPRLESAAEIRRLKRDGADMVGMTGMPEAALAMELNLPYACLAVVVNWAAGLGTGAIHAEIETHLSHGMAKAHKIIQGLNYGAT
ncbi:MAG: S-methyl-5'-thioinosine phosphorylase [Oceanococcus sp.]